MNEVSSGARVEETFSTCYKVICYFCNSSAFNVKSNQLLEKQLSPLSVSEDSVLFWCLSARASCLYDNNMLTAGADPV